MAFRDLGTLIPNINITKENENLVPEMEVRLSVNDIKALAKTNVETQDS